MYFLALYNKLFGLQPTFLTTGFCSFRSKGEQVMNSQRLPLTQGWPMAVEFTRQDNVSSEGQLPQEELD